MPVGFSFGECPIRIGTMHLLVTDSAVQVLLSPAPTAPQRVAREPRNRPRALQSGVRQQTESRAVVVEDIEFLRQTVCNRQARIHVGFEHRSWNVELIARQSPWSAVRSRFGQGIT